MCSSSNWDRDSLSSTVGYGWVPSSSQFCETSQMLCIINFLNFFYISLTHCDFIQNSYSHIIIFMSLQSIQLATSDKVQYVQHAPSLIDQMKAGDMEVINQLLDYTDQCLKSMSETVIRKFLLVRMMKDGIIVKSGKLINQLANHKTLLQQLEELCSYDAGNPDENRGRAMFKNQGNFILQTYLSDPQTSTQLLRLSLELVSHLGTTYPADAKKNPTKFKLLFDRLKQKNVHFPPQSDLMLPLKKVAQQVEPPPSKLQQHSQFEPNQQEVKNDIMLKLNNLKKQIQEDIDMINDTLREGEGEMEYVNDVLETYAKSFKMASETFRKQILEAHAYEDTLSEAEFRQLMEMQDFTAKFPPLYQQYLASGSTASAFEKLKQRSLQMISRIGNNDGTPLPPMDQPQKISRQDSTLLQEQQRREQQAKEQLARQQQEEARKKKEDEDKRLNDEKKRKEENDKRAAEQQRLVEERNNALRKQEESRRQDDQRRQEESRRQEEQKRQEKLRQQPVITKQQNEQFHEQDQFLHSQFGPQDSFSQQKKPPQGLGQQQFENNRSQMHFDHDFENMSVSSISQSQLPGRGMKLPMKDHRGRLVHFDESSFAMMHQYQISDSLIKRWKNCNFRGEGILLEASEFQLGVTSALHFNVTQQKSYLRLTLFMGNKVSVPIHQFNVIYEGDNEKLILWTNSDQQDQVIAPKSQLKQEVIMAFRDASYTCPTVIIDALIENRPFHAELFLPATLFRFVDFKDIDPAIFRPKWRSKKSQIIKSEMFRLNNQIVKSISHFKRFFPKLCELIPFNKFMEQRIDYNSPNPRYLNYKLGGVFELFEAATEYMIKVIIYPNLMGCVQMIPHQTNSRISEQLLNTIVHVIGTFE